MDVIKMDRDNIEEILKQLGSENVPADVQKIAEETGIDFSETLTKQPRHYVLWENIMRSRITKLAAAAIITVAVLAIIFSEHSNTTAYAFEQTMAAVNSIRHFHFKLFVDPPDKNLNKEYWVEYDPNGAVKNIRFDVYDKGKISVSLVWKEGKTEQWIRSKERRFRDLMFFEDADYSKKILFFASRYNPRGALEYLDSLEKEGKVKIQIEEPAAGQGDILVTAIYEPNTYLLQHQMPAVKDVYHIDSDSKLVKTVEIFELDPNGPKDVGSYEYCDYNQPFAPELLDLDREAPPDVNRIDMMAMDTGIEQGNLSDSEIAVEAATQFLDAMVCKNYALAGKLFFVEMTEQQAEQVFGDFHILRVISIDEPKLNEYMSWTVPFKAKIEKDGETTEQESALNVSKVIGHPTRWGVWFEELK
jgi:hypothetical protein